ncbi:hypothetical protein H6800_00580 [Candidatus Nomurabacteria bacterium]|nr:hypothetical protein [Candidatus Nomurabacteria bacterium]
MRFPDIYPDSASKSIESLLGDPELSSSLGEKLDVLKPGDPIIVSERDIVISAGIVYPRACGRKPFEFNAGAVTKKPRRTLEVDVEVPLWKVCVLDHHTYGDYIFGGGMTRSWSVLGHISIDQSGVPTTNLTERFVYTGWCEVEELADNGTDSRAQKAADMLLFEPREIPVATDGINIVVLSSQDLN